MYLLADLPGSASDETDNTERAQHSKDLHQIRQTLPNVSSGGGSYLRPIPEIPGHDVPDGSVPSIDARFQIQFKPILGSLIGIVARNEAAINSLPTRRFQNEQAFRFHTAVERIEIGHVRMPSARIRLTNSERSAMCGSRIRERRFWRWSGSRRHFAVSGKVVPSASHTPTKISSAAMITAFLVTSREARRLSCLPAFSEWPTILPINPRKTIWERRQ